MEDYKQIPGYENYAISRRGEVKNLKTEKILNPFIVNSYLLVSLYDNGKRTKMHIHKIMAITYLNHVPNGSKIVVDHINEDKLDNRIENLQIITQRENISRSIQKELPIGVRCVGNKYTSYIRIGNKRPKLGTFDTPEEAHQAYLAAIPQ